VGQEAVVNLRLEVGDLIQQVTVTADAPVVNTTTAPVSGVVGERQVKDLPLNGRSFDNLITLNPGTINYSAMKSAQTSTSNGSTFAVAGRRTSENLFLLNGVEYTGTSQLAITPGGVSGQLLGIDAVREFNVLTDTYDAEYGKRAGAQVSVVTQSGANALHGSVFEFLRNSALDARNFFDQAAVPPFRRNQFGASAGGPLKKNRVFLFGNYEGFRQALAVSNVSVVPDENARQGLLPGTTVNPSMLKYMTFWPTPNGPELGGERRWPTIIPSRAFAKISARCERTTSSAIETLSPRPTQSMTATASYLSPTRCSDRIPRSAARWPACGKLTFSRLTSSTRRPPGSPARPSITIRSRWLLFRPAPPL